MTNVARLLHKPEFPRSNRYDPQWVLDNQMGPNALWLVEWLGQTMPLEPGMRVLDLGCGRALTSIFLAREFGVHVWATDLWITPDHNWQRVLAAGLADRVCPLRAEAHALPFAEGFFDAAVSIDAYQYFGTDMLYLGYLSRFVRPGGLLGVVVPGLMQPVGEHPPEHLRRPQANGKVFWEDECRCFQTAERWRETWGHNGCVTDVCVDALADGWRHWRDFEKAAEKSGKNRFPSDAQALDEDRGRTIGFIRMTARRTDVPVMNAYDPATALRVGADG